MSGKGYWASGYWKSKYWASGYWAGAGVEIVWTEPFCTITTGITMTANAISTNITMTETEIKTNIGMGCGNQG